MRTSGHQLIALAALLACGRPPPEKLSMLAEPETIASDLTALGIVPGTHDRLWLKEGVGVVDASGATVLADPQHYDDLAVLDAKRVALIQRNDGYVYELGTHRLLNRFCYLPGDELPNPGPTPMSQQSFVVGWDPAAQRIYVQPQTFDEAGRRVGGAQVGVFAANQATALEWQPLGEPADMQAGGIAVESRARIWLGWQQSLYLYDLNARSVLKTFELDVTVQALALDGDQLLVLSPGKLSSLPLATLR